MFCSSAALEAIFMSILIIGDGVVIWRTWATYQRRLLVILVPSVLLLVFFAIFDTICTNGTLPGGQQICPWMSLVVMICPYFTFPKA
ncbi:hypothetical protein B0H14DRAFT_2796216 [Mycena olivaceomarginata]|nr:hypothetical protein B0H14DRAFT_2796216 [Mycena olivaceomarginata]